LSERSFRLHRASRIVPRALRRVALVAAQTEAHAGRFEALGVGRERIAVTGNMKYDLTSVESDRVSRTELRQKLGFAPGTPVIIGGSLHPREDEDLLAAFHAVLEVAPDARLVIVPRYPDQAEAVMRNVAEAGLAAVAGSELGPGRPSAAGEVVVVDTLGELRRYYAASDIAFVGGSLYYRGSNKGGHNLMEPAILGLPVLFGPYNYSFSETVADLLAADAGIEVRDRDELAAALTALVRSETRRIETGRRAQRIVLDGQGASKRNFELLLPLLESAPACSATPDAAQCRHQPQSRIVNE
jgi:3-deoxy-D-manno-octulosonic-acid transferase